MTIELIGRYCRFILRFNDIRGRSFLDAMRLDGRSLNRLWVNLTEANKGKILLVSCEEGNKEKKTVS